MDYNSTMSDYFDEHKEVLKHILDFGLVGYVFGMKNLESTETYAKITIPKGVDFEITSFGEGTQKMIRDVIGDRPYKTEEDLLNLAKYLVRDAMTEAIPTDDEYGEAVRYAFSTVKIFVKTEDKIWTIEDAEAAIKELNDKIQDVSNYKEI